MFKNVIIIFYLIMSYLLTGYYIYESISAYRHKDTTLFNNTTMTFVCLGLSLLFLSFYVNTKIKRITNYKPDSDKLLKYYALSIFWLTLICLINYLLILWKSGFLNGKYFFWQLSSLILGIILMGLLVHTFTCKKRYYF